MTAQNKQHIAGTGPQAKVKVPATLRNPHPVVAALRADKRRLGLTGEVRGRALRILEALARAAESRGYAIREVRLHRNEHGYTWLESKNHLVVETGDTSVGIRVVQQTDRSPHVPTTQELDRQKRHGSRPSKYDHMPNDYLRIEIDSRWDGRQHSWSDGKRGPIDRKLPAILDEIEWRHTQARERRLEAQRAGEEREQRRLEAVERAKALLRESHRAEVLAKQVADWRHTNQLRQYVEAMAEVVEQLDDADERRVALEWVEWAREHAGAIDPLALALRMPDDPKVTNEALRPYLRY